MRFCIPYLPRDSREFLPPFDRKTTTLTNMLGRLGHFVTDDPEVAHAGDFLCLTTSDLWPIAEQYSKLIPVESGIGYSHVRAQYRIFESYAWMHTLYGAWAGSGQSAVGHYYDTVIPGAFDINEFPFGDGSGGYLLYFGRLTKDKGLDAVAAVQRATGLPLKVAGIGDYRPDCEYEYLGHVEDRERSRLMGDALCLLAPTQYVEPFGNVAVEAMLCGTPAITTDWGGFTETVPDRYRCRTLAQFLVAVSRAAGQDRHSLQGWAQARFSTDTIAPMYERYFERLSALQGDGWYSLPGELVKVG